MYSFFIIAFVYFFGSFFKYIASTGVYITNGGAVNTHGLVAIFTTPLAITSGILSAIAFNSGLKDLGYKLTFTRS